MHIHALPVLAVLACPAFAFEATGPALSFASAREGTCVFEPRVEIATARFEVQAGDALEYDVFLPSACALRAGAEVTFADGRRSEAPRVEQFSTWIHQRVPLDAYVGATVVRFELVARGSLADEIGYRVDDIVVTHSDGEPFVAFRETLQSGARLVRDDVRHSGAALTDADAHFDGVRARLESGRLVEPWSAYDMTNLRRGADGVAAGTRPDAPCPQGMVLIGPCVPMDFGRAGERTCVRAKGQQLSFEPLEGAHYYTAWLAVSSDDGAAITARASGYGDEGERCAIDIVLPAAGTTSELSVDLGGCTLLEIPIASAAALHGIELPEEPHLRVHAITIQWRKDALNSPQFRAAWLTGRVRTARDITPALQRQVWRYVRNRTLGSIFGGVDIDDEADRTIFSALVSGDSATFEGALAAQLAAQSTRGEPLRSLRIAVENIRDGRGTLQVESGADGEDLLRSIAQHAPGNALVIEGDTAELAQAPQLLAGLGIGAAIVSDGPAAALWRGPDMSCVGVLAPFGVFSDARGFGDLAWRKWLNGVRSGGASPEIFLSVPDDPRSRAAADELTALFARVDCTPVVWRASAESFLDQALVRSGANTPMFAPDEVPAIAEADARARSEQARARRRAAAAITLLSSFATPASTYGSAYPNEVIDELERRGTSSASGTPDAGGDALTLRAESELGAQLEILVRGASTLGKGTPIVAFNALPWSRPTFVQLDTPSATLIASSGTKLPSQLTASGTRIFELDVPAVGYEVVHALQGDPAPTEGARSKLVVEGTTARNANIAFTIDAATGALTSLELVPGHVEMLAGPALLAGDGWTVESAAFVESGPLRAIARIELTSSRGRARIEFVLGARSQELEVRLTSAVDETGPALALRVPLRHTGPRVLVGVPFGFAVSGPLAGGSPSRLRLADWMASTDGDKGVAVLAGDCTSALVEPGVIALECESNASTTAFALYPFNSGWKTACFAGRAAEFATPVQLVATDAHAGACGARRSFVSIARVNALGQAIEGSACGVVLSSLEPDEDGKSWLLRLVETTRSPAEVAITLDRPVFSAERVDLRGASKGALRFDGRSVRLTLDPCRIQTIRVRLRP